VFTESYPVTSTGKVRRVELREMAAAALAAIAPTEALSGPA
jgi:acyl-coenzyme A synthetase/AMP-(fatty) acid ligase